MHRSLTTKLMLFLCVALTAGLLTACGDDGTTPPGDAPAETETPEPTPTEAAQCSASGMSAELPPQDGLPEQVAATRERIAQLAVACDFDGLAELGREGEGFSFTFGAESDPARYWKKLEKSGREPVTQILVQLLNLSYCTQSFESGGEEVTYFSWPAAFCENPSDEEWAEVEALYTPEEIEQMKEFGGYLGWRVGITEEGDWAYFIAGD